MSKRVMRKKSMKVERKGVAPPPGDPGGPCARCLALAFAGKIRRETVMPLPLTAPPLAEDSSGPCCHDCQAADALGKTVLGGSAWGATEPGGQKRPLGVGLSFSARRVCVGNERQEQLRLPESLRMHFGLVARGLVRPSVGPNALAEHHAWLTAAGIAGIAGDDDADAGVTA